VSSLEGTTGGGGGGTMEHGGQYSSIWLDILWEAWVMIINHVWEPCIPMEEDSVGVVRGKEKELRGGGTICLARLVGRYVIILDNSTRCS